MSDLTRLSRTTSTRVRDLMEAWRDARRTALQTLIKVATTGILALFLVGAAIKLKVWGGH